MVHLASVVAIGLTALTGIVSAHPGHDVRAEAAERAEFLKNAPIHSRSLAQCSSRLQRRGQQDRNVARRHMAVKNIRRRLGLQPTSQLLKARSDSALDTSHHSNLTGVEPSTDPDVLFGTDATCILAPDVTQGPYYVTGELVRKNMAESQEGIPLYMDIQLIDTNTCEPIPEIYMDLWHCNSTGVYSGVVASGNGNSGDETNLNTTFLRGIQKSNREGVVQMQTTFPGHYTGRATHIHVLTHPANETTVLPNGTLSGLYSSHSSHVGQIFFDQDLISAADEISPYSTNTQEVTLNSDDSILSEELDTIDPFMEYVYLGDDLSDGIFAWISVGMDPTVDTTVSPAAYYTEEGGVANENSGAGMGGGGGGAPSGSFSGAAPTSSPTSV
ncbi:Intradiol ring-cleavage dioxygenase, core [Penicillium expansum]|uniref:Intradiol ring-cleavage dioxygenase, core n=1 Tax=Penicillium expansum TaxID=27334 RepID=A0A0A2KRQ9_PENEN|nr:Intradiol ring-cleavage dioxygenase, core [Penicillium expansum]KAJ5519333.1 Intradiol ring-cleavage dioxygenase core [Penicillium expansum]KGO49103.1 Intradiol ring-cleavage dioxygenase, core [Penicillium expansum]KGO57801.1 Intradiol ring-cleavage dioxygenase, core [Penicillium expansum]KGO70449.1 Intradiol ring-cleavage dioxygenase, core [Penicillium expansum]